MTSEQFLFCCYNRSANLFFLGMCRAIFFIVIFFFGKGGTGGGVCVKIGSICVLP